MKRNYDLIREILLIAEQHSVSDRPISLKTKHFAGHFALDVFANTLKEVALEHAKRYAF